MNGKVPIDGERVKRLAFFQLSAAQIAACLGCDADLILSTFAAEYRQGKDLGKAMLLQSLMLSAVKHQNVPAQLFLAQSLLGISSQAMLATQRAAREEEERVKKYKLDMVEFMPREDRERRYIELVKKYPHFLDGPCEGRLRDLEDIAAQELAEEQGKKSP